MQEVLSSHNTTVTSRSPLLPYLINAEKTDTHRDQPHAVTSLSLSIMGKESGPPATPLPPQMGGGEELAYRSRSISSDGTYLSVTALSPFQCHDSGLDSPSGSHCSVDSTEEDDSSKRYLSLERDSANSSPSSPTPRFYYTENNGMFSITETYIKHQREAVERDANRRLPQSEEEEEEMEISEASNVSDTSDDMSSYGRMEVSTSIEQRGNYHSNIKGQTLSSDTSFRQLLSSPGNQTDASGTMPVATNELHQCHWLQCTSKFVHLDDLVTHVNDAHVRAERDVDYKCYWSDCPRKGKGFNARYKMLIHVRTHTNEKPYKCDLCKKSFSRLENLKIHNRSHTGERPYICPFEGCNKAYSNSSDRFKHVRTHQEQKPYSCRMPGCDKRYTDPSSLRKHVKTHGHYFKQLPASKGAKLRHHRQITEEKIRKSLDSKSVNLVPHVLSPQSSTNELPGLSYENKERGSSDVVLSPNGNKEEDQESTHVTSSMTNLIPQISYHTPDLSLPTYISTSSPSLPPTLPLATTTTQLPYPGGKDLLLRHPAVLCGREEALKHSYEHSLLSHLSPLSHHHLPFLGSPLTLGNALLAQSPSGIPSTLPAQVISIHGNMVQISSLGNERALLDSGTLRSPYTTSLPQTQPCTGLISHHHSPLHPDLLSLYRKLPSQESLQHLQVSPHSKLPVPDMPLDLSNPSDKRGPTYIGSPDKRPTYIDTELSPEKRPTYINTHLLQNTYRPVLAHVSPT